MSDLQFGTIMVGLLSIWFGVASLEPGSPEAKKAAFFSGLAAVTTMVLTLYGVWI